MKLVLALSLLVNGLAVCLARPQGGYNYPNPNQGGSRPSGGNGRQPSRGGGFGDYSGSADTNSGASTPFGGGNAAAGGPLSIECKRQETSPGQFKFNCEGVQKDLITLKSEHILWLQGADGSNQAIEIEVPNYKIDELIKAGFTEGKSGGGTQINVLLKRPEQTYEAEADVQNPGLSQPSVSLQYEPVGPATIVHFPNDKDYRPLSGPILPPARQ